MKLAKVLDWPKELFGFGGEAKLSAKLKEIGADAATVVAMMAAASSELSVNSYNLRKSIRLDALAKSFSVNTTVIRKEVEAEVSGKGKGKTSAPATKTKATAKKPVQKTAKKKASTK